jgi:hypothetical protein
MNTKNTHFTFCKARSIVRIGSNWVPSVATQTLLHVKCITILSQDNLFLNIITSDLTIKEINVNIFTVNICNSLVILVQFTQC